MPPVRTSCFVGTFCRACCFCRNFATCCKLCCQIDTTTARAECSGVLCVALSGSDIDDAAQLRDRGLAFLQSRYALGLGLKARQLCCRRDPASPQTSRELVPRLRVTDSSKSHLVSEAFEGRVWSRRSSLRWSTCLSPASQATLPCYMVSSSRRNTLSLLKVCPAARDVSSKSRCGSFCSLDVNFFTAQSRVVLLFFQWCLS